MSATTTVRPGKPRPPRKRALWRDPAGKFSWLKAIALVLVILPGLDIAVAFASGALGGRPITEAIHEIGDWTIAFIMITLAITPARTVLDWPRVVLLRRMLGVTAAAYALAHFALYCLDEKWHVGVIASEIVLRIYLTIGFIALCGLAALAATSFDSIVRRMGQHWFTLHRLLYPLAALAVLHFFMQSKSNVSDAVFVAGVFVWLMLWRAVPKRLQGRLWLLPPLACAAGLLTAGIEYLWYAVATGVDPMRVLAANLTIAFGPRPAVQVALLGLALTVLVALRRLVRRLRLPWRPRIRAIS